MSEGNEPPVPKNDEKAPRFRPDWALILPMLTIMFLTLVFLALLLLWRAGIEEGTDFSWSREGVLRFIEEADQDFYAVLTSVLFLVLGLSMFGLIKGLFADVSIKGDALFIAVLLIPIISYLLLAGHIAGFAAGGVSVELHGSQLVDSVSIGKRAVGTPFAGGGEAESCAEAAEATEVVPREFTVPRGDTGVTAPFAQVLAPPRQAQVEQAQVQQAQVQQAAVQQQLEPPAPTPTVAAASSGAIVFLTLELNCRYDASSLATRVADLAQSEAFEFVVLVWGKDDFEAAIPAGAAVDLMAAAAESFVQAIEGDTEALQNPTVYPGLEFVPLSQTDTTLAALQRMRDQNLDALVIVDGSGNLVGVVTIEEVTASMLLELANDN